MLHHHLLLAAPKYNTEVLEYPARKYQHRIPAPKDLMHLYQCHVNHQVLLRAVKNHVRDSVLSDTDPQNNLPAKSNNRCTTTSPS
jgi:hypothetical protein